MTKRDELRLEFTGLQAELKGNRQSSEVLRLDKNATNFYFQPVKDKMMMMMNEG